MTFFSLPIKAFIQIYWSIIWRTHLFMFTLLLILSQLFLLAIDVFYNLGELSLFKKIFFLFLPFNSQEEIIKQPTFLMECQSSLWLFLSSYIFYLYGFQKVLRLHLYPSYLDSSSPYSTYNKLFLLPLILFSGSEVCFFPFKNGSLLTTFVFSALPYLFYYGNLYRNFKKWVNLSTP